MSPRDATTARLPVLEMRLVEMASETSTVRGRAVSIAPGIFTSTGRVAWVPRSTRNRPELFWNTISPWPWSPGPIAGHFTSKSV